MKKVILPMIIAGLLGSVPAHAAKVAAMKDLDKLPEKEDEAELWELASGHENRLRNRGVVLENRELEAYLESLADRMLGNDLDHLGISIDFLVVEEPTLSAWVYPYGTVAVHTGLLVRMDNEAQLASILAHEISHFLQRHSYRELISEGRQSALGKGLGFLATLAVAKETGSFDRRIMDTTGGIWTNLVTSGYSRENEYVADEEGLTLMAKAGLAREQSLPAFQALAENEVYGAGDPRKLWSSHPKLEDRLENLQKEIRRDKRRKGAVAGAVPEPGDYYRAIAPALMINAKLDINLEQQYGRAREALLKYLSVMPQDAEAHFLVGESLRMENPAGPDFTKSMTSYNNALQHDSEYAAAYREIGMAYRLQGNNSEARKAFERYLDIAPDEADAGIVRGYLEGL